MKPDIHPTVHRITAVCACGASFETISTRESLVVDICAACHPFFTGTQKFVDTEGRIDKFQRKFGKDAATSMKVRKKKAQEPAESPKVASAQAD